MQKIERDGYAAVLRCGEPDLSIKQAIENFKQTQEDCFNWWNSQDWGPLFGNIIDNSNSIKRSE